MDTDWTVFGEIKDKNRWRGIGTPRKDAVMHGETEDTFNAEVKTDNRKVMMPCEVWSRVVGYYRPVSNYNPGKQAEFNDRLPFVIPKELTK
jgi:hypothetical protein